MPQNRPRHGKNGTRVDPKSSLGMQHKDRYGEVLPPTRPFKPTLRMQQADPTTKEWKEYHEYPVKKETTRIT